MVSTFDLGFAIDGFAPANDIAEQSKAAESGGASTIWIASHLFLRDPVTLAAAALAATKELKVALMAISPFAIHPVHIAMSAATLEELYPGRIVLCLGAGAPVDFQAASINRSHPVKTLRETIMICQALFSGKEVLHKGDVFQLSGRKLVNSPRKIPIVLAASGPKMLDLAGKKADGVIISAATSPPFVRKCLEKVKESEGEKKVWKCGLVYTALSNAKGESNSSLKKTLAFILRGAHHSENVQLGGSGLDQAALKEVYEKKNWDLLEEVVTNEVLSGHAAVGNAIEVCERLISYRSAGLDHIVINGISDPEKIYSTLQTIIYSI